MDNEKRADRAQRAVNAWAGRKHDEADFRDLLCDLHHLADRLGLDMADQLQMGAANYLAETGNSSEDEGAAPRAKPVKTCPACGRKAHRGRCQGAR